MPHPSLGLEPTGASARSRLAWSAMLSVMAHAAAVGLAALLPTATPSSQAVLIVELPDGGTDELMPAPADAFDLPSPAEETPAELETPESQDPSPVEVVDLPPAVFDDPFVQPTPLLKSPHNPATTRPAVAPSRPPGAATGGNPGAVSGPGAPGNAGRSIPWSLPRPAYPYPARLKRLVGSGSVRIHTDASGRVVSAEMVQPIAPELDGPTVSFARARWSGPPNQTVVVPVTYRPQ